MKVMKNLKKVTVNCIITLFSVIFILISCSKSTVLAPVPTPGANEVWMQNTTFVPSVKKVTAGTTIKWINKDNVTHDITSNTGDFISPPMGKNDSFTYTFNSAGTYEYKCTFHTTMTGKIIVQ